jgi:GT2 family glycosyltransferase
MSDQRLPSVDHENDVMDTLNDGSDRADPDYWQSSTAESRLQRSRRPANRATDGRTAALAHPRRIVPRTPDSGLRRGPSLPLHVPVKHERIAAVADQIEVDEPEWEPADVSIVIVHWNVAHLLDACLRSVIDEIGRSGLSAEVIVVDSASPDQRYREVVDRFDGVELIELDANDGYAAGCNAGIRASDGKAILLLNPDTELLPGSLRTLWDTLTVAPHVAMTAPLLLNTDGSIQSAGYRFPGVANVLFDLFPPHPRLVESPLNGRVPVGDGVQPIRIDYPLGAVMMLRREALARVGLLDERYGMYSEEIDLARQLAADGWTTLLAPAARVIHHGGRSTGQRPDAMHEALWSSRAKYFARYGTPRQRAVIAAIVGAGTRLDDRSATEQRQTANARIRQRFREIARQR